MRPTVSYLLYRIYGGQEPIDRLTPFLALSELNNYYCYLDNWILDDKEGIKGDIDKIRGVTIASAVLRELTQSVLEGLDISEEERRRISLRLAETTTRSYEGQFRDLSMTFDSIGSYPSEEDYVKAYVEKSRLQSGFLYGLSGEIGTVCARAGELEIERVRKICETLGTGIHISNDLGDFSVFIEDDGSFKPSQDQLADLINGRLTFPAYYTLKHGDEKEKKALFDLIGRREATREERLRASQSIVSSGAYDTIRGLLNDFYHEFKRGVHRLPVCAERDALSSVGETIRYNKYLRGLQKLNRARFGE